MRHDSPRMGDTTWGLVVSVEHASRAVPPAFDNLGVDPLVFETHAAWDPCAPEVGSIVAARCVAPLFLGAWTRLLVDLNRSAHNPQAVPTVAFGVHVPANVISEDERTKRLERFHRPYWLAVEHAVRDELTRSDRVLHLSVHSFTPEYDGIQRVVDLGVMIDPERPLERFIADRWIPTFVEHGFRTGENVPYDGRADALVTGLRSHFDAAVYAGVEIEINQRLAPNLDPVAEAVYEAVAKLL